MWGHFLHCERASGGPPTSSNSWHLYQAHHLGTQSLLCSMWLQQTANRFSSLETLKNPVYRTFLCTSERSKETQNLRSCIGGMTWGSIKQSVPTILNHFLKGIVEEKGRLLRQLFLSQDSANHIVLLPVSVKGQSILMSPFPYLLKLVLSQVRLSQLSCLLIHVFPW